MGFTWTIVALVVFLAIAWCFLAIAWRFLAIAWRFLAIAWNALPHGVRVPDQAQAR